MKKISRRDFLKLGWKSIELALAASLFPGHTTRAKTDKKLPNIVVLVCDAMSAKNLSLYGYSRKTTPNLEKLAERAFVYHNHYANGNFTTPGTASLLTGLKPWTHRAINLSGVIKKDFLQHSIFNLLGEDYFKLAYTQNLWASYLLDQFSPYIDTFLPSSEFGLINGGAINQNFANDHVISNHAFEKMIYYNNSLLLSFIHSIYYQLKVKSLQAEDYPMGYPIAQYYDYIFTMQDLFDGITNKIIELSEDESPFFTYFHIYPPHHPYAPHKDFAYMFDKDNYQSIVKPEHTLSIGSNQLSLDNERNKYDSFVANVDMEIGRLLATLSAQGILENTYFILTSDHGEMFERGVEGHVTPLLYESVIKIPLMIFAPGNQTRQDFITPTSNIDLLPTILALAGKPIPLSCEGDILPGLGEVEDSNRAVISMDAKESPAHQTFTKATYTIIKRNYKLIYYTGYNHKYKNHFEFYDLRADPEELRNKYSRPEFSTIVDELKQELLNSIETANQNILS